MEKEKLEILITKYLDGRISPEEQHTLDAQLANNNDARMLFEQILSIHRAGAEVINTEIFGKGQPFEDIFERAWAKHSIESQQSQKRRYRLVKWYNFAAGLAAGIVIGLAAGLILPSSENTVPAPLPTEAAISQPQQARPFMPVWGTRQQPSRVNVDLYHFTDQKGDQWLVEGFRSDMIKPAGYQKKL